MITLDQQLDSLKPQWLALVASLKPARRWRRSTGDTWSEESYATEEQAEADCTGHEEPRLEWLDLTVGFTPGTAKRDCSWSYQTGDNSFTGGAYGHPAWAVLTLDADTDPVEAVSDIADQLGEFCAD